MFIQLKRISLIITYLMVSKGVYAQQNTHSPYSLFGVGIMHYSGFADNAANGRNGFSYRGESNYSLANPSSLSGIKASVFNVAPYMDLGKFKTSAGSQNFSNAGLGYIALAIPVNKLRSGLSFGLLPFSDVGYNIINVKDSSGVALRNEFEGSGGLSKLNIGFGTKVYKHISVGANYSRIFGQVNETERKRYPGNRFMTSYEEVNALFLKGHHFDLGLQLHNASDSGLSQVIGLVFSTHTNLKGENDHLLRTFTELSDGLAYPRDTLINEKSKSVKMSLPSSLNVSYSIGNFEKWQATAGYGKTLWSDYKNIFGDNGGLMDDQHYSLGFFVCPIPHFDNSIKGKKFTRYIQSIRYTIGFSHNDGYYQANNHRISENALCLGFGLPFTKIIRGPEGNKMKFTSRIFITGEFVRRGTMADNLIQEDFFKITMGLNLADKWFNKRLFN